jgi:hypothetical protein
MPNPKPSAKNEKGEASKFQFEEGKPALENFTRTMQALFRVPKSKVQDTTHKSTASPRTRKGGS